MIMRPQPGTELSVGSSSWMKRLSSIWNVENIKVVRRVIVSVIGATVLLIGVALLVLPGPAFIVIPIGLAILATEYAWARRWLKKVRRMASNVVSANVRFPRIPGFSFALGGGEVNQGLLVGVATRKPSANDNSWQRDSCFHSQARGMLAAP